MGCMALTSSPAPCPWPRAVFKLSPKPQTLPGCAGAILGSSTATVVPGHGSFCPDFHLLTVFLAQCHPCTIALDLLVLLELILALMVTLTSWPGLGPAPSLWCCLIICALGWTWLPPLGLCCSLFWPNITA